MRRHVRERPRQVLFIQGAGEGTHDEWDSKLADSLRTELGAGFEIRYPRMPGEDDPSETTWVPAIRHELSTLEGGAVVVGHSVGGTILVHALVDETPAGSTRCDRADRRSVRGSSGGWPADEFEAARSDLGAQLPSGVP